MGNDGIRTIATFGGHKVEVEDGYAVFIWGREKLEWSFLDSAADEADAKQMCDQAILDGSDGAYYARGTWRYRDRV